MRWKIFTNYLVLTTKKLHQLYAFGEEENLQQLSRWKNSVKFRNGDTIKCCEVIHISSVYSRFMINNRYNYQTRILDNLDQCTDRCTDFTYYIMIWRQQIPFYFILRTIFSLLSNTLMNTLALTCVTRISNISSGTFYRVQLSQEFINDKYLVHITTLQDRCGQYIFL